MYYLRCVYSPTASLFVRNFLYNYVKVHKISTDVVRRAVPLRQLSFLLLLLAVRTSVHRSLYVRRILISGS